MRYLSLLILTIFVATSCNQVDSTKEKESSNGVKKELRGQNIEPIQKEVKKDVVKKDETVKSESITKKAPKVIHGEITDETVMAEINGQKILFKDIKKNYSNELKEAMNESLKKDHEKASLQVNRFAIETLLTAEAKKQGLKNHKELLDKITSSIPQPSQKEIDEMKQKYAKQFADKKMDDKEVTKLVADYILNQKKNDVAFKFLEKLKKDKGFKVTLPSPDIPTLKIDIFENDPFKGPKDAKYVIVEFSDFECPYCSRVAPVVSGVTKDNKDVKVVFKHFPLSFHKMANKASLATQCANNQGKFWEFHDKIFENQKDLNDANLEKWAKELKLDMGKYKACLTSPETKKVIDTGILIGSKIGVKGTPSLFLNGVQVNASTKELLNEAIQAERDKIIGTLNNDTVIATVDGKQLKWSDFLAENKNFDTLSKSEKMKEEYELYAKLLSKELSKQILGLAAKENNDKNIDEYVKKIIDAIKDPTEKELNDLYNQLKPKLQGQSFDQIKPQLIQYSKRMQGQNAVQDKMKELSKKYNVNVTMPLPALPKLNINIEGASFMGNKDAKHTLVEFSDFQCPYCSKAATFTKEILAKYPNDVKVVFKHFPLPFHPNAKGAAIASICADKQGKFKEFHYKAFENQDKLTEENFLLWATEFKLSMDDFKKCLKDENISKKIDEDMREGQEIGVQGTPTLYLDGVLYNSPHDITSFSEFIK
jgi:protein-disulfide isomerase